MVAGMDPRLRGDDGEGAGMTSESGMTRESGMTAKYRDHGAEP